MTSYKAAKGIFIVAAKRTPFGTFGGKLKNITPTDLATHTVKAALSSAEIKPETVGAVFAGNVIQSGSDAAYLARHVGLKSGLPINIPALTVNRLCGSGFESVMLASEAIELGQGHVMVAAGAESMSSTPFHCYNARWRIKLGEAVKLEDSLWACLTDSYCNLPMGMTAENLAVRFGITREDCDKMAMESQNRYYQAKARGIFKAEICPIDVKGKKGMMEVMDTDEHPRMPEPDKISKLNPVFKKGGVITAANASGINDGAGCLILASEEALRLHNYKPLARVIAWSRTGVDPALMGLGPVGACNNALGVAGLTMEEMDLVEVNEAFSAQYLAVVKQLSLDQSKTNVNGGAIALGHPLGASGSRIMSHLTHELRRTNKRYGIGSACCGGGQGVAIIIEKC